MTISKDMMIGIAGLFVLIGIGIFLGWQSNNTILNDFEAYENSYPDEYNQVFYKNEVFMKDGRRMIHTCSEHDPEYCYDLDCTFANYVKEKCIVPGTNSMNTHTYEEMHQFNDCCDTICNSINYTTGNTIAKEFKNTCYCYLKDKPFVQINLEFEVNHYFNFTPECNKYVAMQYGEFMIRDSK